jgi:hypothetical protein
MGPEGCIIEDYVFQPKGGQPRRSFCIDFMSATITTI